MKRILLFFFLSVSFIYTEAQTTYFNVAGGGALPAGWVGTNNVTSSAIDRTSYYLLEAGSPGDLLTTSSYDLSGCAGDVELTFNLATFGSGTANPAVIEVSLDGGATYTQSYTSATPSSSTYISSGTITISPVSSDVVIRFSNGGTSGRGVRLQDLMLVCNAPPCGVTFEPVALVCDSNTSGADNDGVSLFFVYNGVDAGITSVTTTTTGTTLFGDDPAVDADGVLVLIGLSEGDAYDITLNGGVCDGITVSGTIPSMECDPTCDITAFGPESIDCDAYTAGNDALTISVPYSGLDAEASVTITVNGSGVANAGDDPATVTDGTISFAVIEGDTYTIMLTDSQGACSFPVISGTIAIGTCPEITSPTIDVSTDAAAAGGNSSAANNAALALDDAMHGVLDDACIAAGGVYTPVYGAISWDPCTYTGTITGLILPDGTAYTGTATFTLVNDIDIAGYPGMASTGTSISSGCGCGGGTAPTINSANGMQGNAPLPLTDENGNPVDNFSESCIDNNQVYDTNRAGIIFSFDPAISDFGVFLGDVETRTDGIDGAAAQVVILNSGNAIAGPSSIPTSTTTQTSCDGDGTSSFDGCGNDETSHLAVSGGPFDQVLVAVGEAAGTSGDNNISFGGVSLGGTCSVEVPVELMSFTVTKTSRRSAQLDWITASETDNKGFEVQRSINGRNFDVIGFVNGQGTSSEVNRYSFVDRNPGKGTNYYRLRQLDFNGNYEYTQVKTINFDGLTLRLIPNIVKDVIRIELGETILQDATIEIFDVVGRNVYSGALNRNTTFSSINVSNLSAGQYFVKVSNQDFSLSERFIKE